MTDDLVLSIPTPSQYRAPVSVPWSSYLWVSTATKRKGQGDETGFSEPVPQDNRFTQEMSSFHPDCFPFSQSRNGESCECQNVIPPNVERFFDRRLTEVKVSTTL